PIADPVFEHRMYLSLATPVILAVFFGDWVLRWTGLTAFGPYLLTAAAIALGVLTFLRNEEYRSRSAVWEVAVERSPNNVRARPNYGQGLLLDGRSEEVIPLLERAVELVAHDPTSLQNLASAYEQLGNFAAAADCYRRLCGYFPGDVKYWRMYGAALLVIATWEAAEETYRRGIEVEEKSRTDNPDTLQQTELRYGRAAALYELGRDAEAEEMIRDAFNLDADWPDGVLALARSVMLDEKMRKCPDAMR